MGIVDLLHGLDLIAGRASAVGADFILAGPLNLWLRGVSPPPSRPLYILVTSHESSGPLRSAISIGAKEAPWGYKWSRISGRLYRATLRGMDVAILADPSIDTGSGVARFRARDMARQADHAVVGRHIVRLAPLHFEYTLKGALGGYGGAELEE
ncbi:MAG: hypothetical protein F7C08_00875 [Desulfurococcales archaeon]|nr:hypothetical protein [Desulfurococcales archaeon]MCE4605074.1 hypothetical protein [Desulfurococcales archaeon]